MVEEFTNTLGKRNNLDMEKVSSSLAVLAKIFEKLADSSRDDYHCFVIILVEYKNSYNLFKTLLLLAFNMVLLDVIDVILV